MMIRLKQETRQIDSNTTMVAALAFMKIILLNFWTEQIYSRLHITKNEWKKMEDWCQLRMDHFQIPASI